MDDETDMCDEYDFSKGERGKYASRFPPGVVAVVLDADVAEAFPNAEGVNEALRALISISRTLTSPVK